MARDIFRSEGARGLCRGLGLTFIREVPAFGSYFFAYETFYKYGNIYTPNWPALVTMVDQLSLGVDNFVQFGIGSSDL